MDADWIPTTEDLREYVEVGGEARPWEASTPDMDAARAAAFDRWLAAHDAEVRAEQAEKDTQIAEDRMIRSNAPIYGDDPIRFIASASRGAVEK